MLLVIIKIIVKIIKIMITVTAGIWSERLPHDASWRVCPDGGGQGGDHQDIGQPGLCHTLINIIETKTSISRTLCPTKILCWSRPQLYQVGCR